MNFKKILKKCNKYMLLLSTIGGLTLISCNSYAVDWTTIKKIKDYELLVDMDSYNETNGLPFITTKFIFNKAKSLDLDKTKIVFIEEHATSQFNCKLKTYKVLETHFFKNKGVLIKSLKSNDSFKPIRKDTDNATIASLVCQVHQMLGG